MPWLLVLPLLTLAHFHPRMGSLMRCRGGEVAVDAEEGAVDPAEDGRPVSVTVATSFGSTFLDKKKRLQLPRNSSVASLKELIESKFPANPPVRLQRLFAGTRYMRDEDLVGNFTSASTLLVLLDMPSGTSVYNKSLTVEQALEAYSALTVQQTFLADKLKSLFSNEPPSPSDETTVIPESTTYRDLFISLNESLYYTYQEDIIDALEAEKEPETITDDTAAWRLSRKPQSPLVAAFAKEFDINLRSFKNFVYFSFLFTFFSYFGTSTEFSSKLLLTMVPMMWVSKLRQLRIVLKVSYLLTSLSRIHTSVVS